MKKLLSRVTEVFQREPRLSYLAYGFLAFLTVTLLVSLVAGFALEITEFKSFWISLTASFWEDLVFFLLLGGIAVLFSLNRPGDEGFENRVRYFFNGDRVTPGAREHISIEMRSLGIFSPLYRAELTFTEVANDASAVKTTFQIDRTVVNMFKDQDFENEKHDYLIEPDDVPMDPAGELLDLYLIDGSRPTHLIHNTRPIVGSGIHESVDFNLKPDQEVSFGYRAWMWFKFGEAYGVKPTRYTELIELKVVNKCGKNLKLFCNRENKELLLTDGAERTYSQSRVPTRVAFTPFRLLEVAK